METVELRGRPGCSDVTPPPPPRQAKRRAPPPPPPPKSADNIPPQLTANHGLVIVRPAPPPPSTKPLLTDFMCSPDVDTFELQTGSKMQTRRFLNAVSLPAGLPTEQTWNTETNGRNENSSNVPSNTPRNQNVSKVQAMPTTLPNPGLSNDQSQTALTIVNDHDARQQQAKRLAETDQKEGKSVERVGYCEDIAKGKPSKKTVEKYSMFEGVVLRQKNIFSSREYYEDQRFCDRVNVDSSDDVFFDLVDNTEAVVQNSPKLIRVQSEVRDSAYEAFAALDAVILSHSQENIYEEIESLDAEDDTVGIKFRFHDNDSVSGFNNKSFVQLEASPGLKADVLGDSLEDTNEKKPPPKPAPRRLAPIAKPAVATSMTNKLDQNEVSVVTANRRVPRPVTRKVLPHRDMETVNGNVSNPLEYPTFAAQRDISNHIGEDDKTHNESVDKSSALARFHSGTIRDRLESSESCASKTSESRLNPARDKNITSEAGSEYKHDKPAEDSKPPHHNKLIPNSLQISHAEISSAAVQAMDAGKGGHATGDQAMGVNRAGKGGHATGDQAMGVNRAGKGGHATGDQAMGVDRAGKGGHATGDQAMGVDRAGKVGHATGDQEGKLSEYSRNVPKRNADGCGADCSEKLNWDPEKCFTMDDVEDPQMKLLFENAGVTDEELQDPKTRQFIYRFLLEHGGMETVKREAHFKATLRLVKRQPRTKLAKEYVARRDHDIHL